MPTGMRREFQKTRKNEPEDHALGRSRGGFGTKIHLVCERNGKPAGAILSPGRRHESPFFEAAMATLSQEVTPAALAGDKAYSSKAIRAWLAQREIQDVIPTRKDEVSAITTESCTLP